MAASAVVVAAAVHTADVSALPPHPPSTVCHCVYASRTFCRIVAECISFNPIRSDNVDVVSSGADPTPPSAPLITPALRVPPAGVAPSSSPPPTHPPIQQPIVISVHNADNEPLCVCSLYASTDRIADTELASTGSSHGAPGASSPVCTVCRHTMRLQPIEPRRTLIAKRLQLSADIIVNRVDTHYLNLNGYAGNGGGGGGDSSSLRRGQDPYTPESIESHSPVPSAGGGQANERCSTFDGARSSSELSLRNGQQRNGFDGYDGVSEAEDMDDENFSQASESGPAEMEINRNTMMGADVPAKKTARVSEAAGGAVSPTRGVSPSALKSRLEDLQSNGVESCLVEAGDVRAADDGAAGGCADGGRREAKTTSTSRACCRYCRIQ